MEDLGYEVDYNGADQFNKADFGSSCQCRRRLGENANSFEDVMMSRHHQERRLSEEGHEKAIADGIAFLEAFTDSSEEGKDGRALGEMEQYATVYVEEHGEIFAVHVQK